MRGSQNRVISFFLSFFLKCAVDWIPLRGGRLLFVCFMTADKRRRFTRSSTAPVFANGVSFSSYSSGSMGGKAFFCCVAFDCRQRPKSRRHERNSNYWRDDNEICDCQWCSGPWRSGFTLNSCQFFFLSNSIQQRMKRCGAHQRGLRNGYTQCCLKKWVYSVHPLIPWITPLVTVTDTNGLECWTGRFESSFNFGVKC